MDRLKFFFSRYKLPILASPNAQSDAAPREGALIKVVNALGRVGYGDLHPWPEFGEGPLSEHLRALRELRLTPLLEQTLWMAKRDAEARARGKSLWPTGVSLKNNFLVTDALATPVASLLAEQQKGFEVVKVKCGRDLQAEAHFVNEVAAQTRLRLRLDFNAITSAERFEAFMMKLTDTALQSLEYVEDPCPYDAETWRGLRSRAKLALDQEWDRADFNKERRPQCDILILKPARRDVDSSVDLALHWGLRLVVTSSMDHPVGVAHAMTTALELKKQHGAAILPAGCLTNFLYEPNAYSAAMPAQGPFLQPVPGKGIGFDALLESTTWTDIKSL